MYGYFHNNHPYLKGQMFTLILFYLIVFHHEGSEDIAFLKMKHISLHDPDTLTEGVHSFANGSSFLIEKSPYFLFCSRSEDNMHSGKEMSIRFSLHFGLFDHINIIILKDVFQDVATQGFNGLSVSVLDQSQLKIPTAQARLSGALLYRRSIQLRNVPPTSPSKQNCKY